MAAAGGCATQHSNTSTPAHHATSSATGSTTDSSANAAAALPMRIPRTAAALAFTPGLAQGVPLELLSRQGRAPQAFAGYEQERVEYYYLYQRDQQVDQDRNGLDRQAYTTRLSVTTR
jgi:hypothetical protein